MTIQDKLDNFPPVLVRLLARRKLSRGHSEPLTDDEIVERPLTIAEVCDYSRAVNWNGIPVVKALAFLRGCGLDIDDADAWRRTMTYLSLNPTFNYLRESPQWKEYFLPLIQLYRKGYPLAMNDLPPNLCPPIRSLLQRLTVIAQG
jgi:hypothetical protein